MELQATVDTLVNEALLVLTAFVKGDDKISYDRADMASRIVNKFIDSGEEEEDS